jgi:hypothetical protein
MRVAAPRRARPLTLARTIIARARLNAVAPVVLIRPKAIRILPIVTHRVGVTIYALIYISR